MRTASADISETHAAYQSKTRALKALAGSITILLTLSIGIGTMPVEAAEPGNSNIELAELLPKIYLAYGGKQALAEFDKNYTMIGDQILPGENGQPLHLHFRQLRQGDRLRIDIEQSGDAAPISTVYDGTGAWKSTGKVVEELTPEQADVLKSDRDHQPAILTRFGETPFIFRLAGRTVYHAAPAYAIEVGRDGQEAQTIFIDEKNYQVLGISYRGTDPSGKNRTNISLDYAQYRPAAGSMYPFKQTQYVNGKPVMELSVTSIDTEADINDAQFRRPDRPNEIRLSKSQVLPFDYSHKEILVKVRINDSEPLDFLFDSAASQTVIDRRTAAENFLDQQGQFTVSAVGGQLPTQMTSIKKLQIGDCDLTDIQALILDMTPQTRQMGKQIAGIIGANIMSRFAVTIDYARSQITLNDAATYKPPATASLVPFAQKQGPVIKALLNGGRSEAFLVDTGAAFNNVPTGVAKAFLSGQTPHTTEGTGLDGRPVKLATLTIGNVKVGALAVPAVNFTYSVEQDSLPPRTNAPINNIGVLGNPFWQNFLVTFDYKFQRLILQQNSQVSSRAEIEQLITTGDTNLIIQRDLRGAQAAYEKALLKVQALGDPKLQARLWGRIGNLRRVMAKDLNRPEQARIAYEYFSKAQELAHKLQDRDAEGRILADWSLLYLDNGQVQEAQQALHGATLYSPQDAQVNVDFAVYLFKMQQYPDMQKYIEKALFLDPANWQALWYKVKLAELFNDTDQLKSTLKEVIKRYPWSKLAKDKLAALTVKPASPPMLVPGPTAVPGNNPFMPSSQNFAAPRTPVSTFAPR